MRRHSLTATLALAMGATTLMVFIAVGGFVYEALEQQVSTQDDLDIVLAARHARRLTEELDNLAGIGQHEERLESTVLGNEAMFLSIADANGTVLLTHNVGAGYHAPAVALAADARITPSSIRQWNDAHGDPVRGIVTLATLRDHASATLLVARRMNDRAAMLDHYRDTLKAAGVAGVMFTAALGYLLIWLSLRPLRTISERAQDVTVAKLDARVPLDKVPSEFVPLIHAFNAMLARLEAGFQQMSRFTADLAHDMRTPISNMRGAMEVALSRPRSIDHYEQLLASNVEECDRLSRMIGNVLFLARAEHPQFLRHKQTFDVRDELTNLTDYFEGVADDAQVSIRVSGAGRLEADLELFRRAVGNLLANAIRHTHRHGAVTVDASSAPGALLVSVFNEGTPVPEADLDRIFERFYRGDPSRNTAPGSTGLGLAIVRTIMELHGGTVTATRAPNGMRFTLQFPQAY